MGWKECEDLRKSGELRNVVLRARRGSFSPQVTAAGITCGTNSAQRYWTHQYPALVWEGLDKLLSLLEDL